MAIWDGFIDVQNDVVTRQPLSLACDLRACAAGIMQTISNIRASLPLRSTAPEHHADRGKKEIPQSDDIIVEKCIEELDEIVTTLYRYPPGAVAVAIGTYLEGLLGALLDERQCTADDIHELLREIESGILEPCAAT